MVTIIFESHATTVDNEEGLASGHFDAELSETGKTQAKELGERYLSNMLDGVFCSDLQRSYKTAEIAFNGKGVPIYKDKRLRECNYGDLTRHTSIEVDSKKKDSIDQPFPNGESYVQTTEKMKSFLEEVLNIYQDKTILIIGSRATQYALEHLINQVDLKTAVTASWAWQPGWTYFLEKL